MLRVFGGQGIKREGSGIKGGVKLTKVSFKSIKVN
jgi:hypothetical protein